MLEGITAVAKSGLDTKALEKEISKDVGEDSFYLEKDRAYRDENNIFSYYTEEERVNRFGVPPRTVFENMRNLDLHKDKLEALKQGGVFTDVIINSFKVGALDKWQKQLTSRIIRNDVKIIRGIEKRHTNDSMDAIDEVNWTAISDLKFDIMKDTLTRKSLFTKIKEAIIEKDYENASNLQLELKDKIDEIQERYLVYKKNIY